MRHAFILAGVAALALTGPAISQGKGKGDGPGGGGPPAGRGGPGKGGDGGRGGRDRGPGPGRGPEGARADRGPGPGDRGPRGGGPGRGPGDDRGVRGERADRGPAPDRGPGRGREDRGPRAERADFRPEDRPGPDRRAGRPPEARGPAAVFDRGPGPERSADRRGFDERVPASRFAERRWDGDRYRWQDRDYRVLGADACPPGLARRGNGCLPPGQARRLDPARGWADWYPVRYQDDRYDWRYDDGYLYGVDPGQGGGLLGDGGGGLLAAIIPLLGGALAGGNLWPQQAVDYDVPDYYDRFYGDTDGSRRYDYRYADDAVFAVDPQSQRIDSIAGLLTGDDWAIGQRMPAGYDLYNIPPSYRARYPDGPDALYRYSDGYVYQVDPGTRLVRSVTELL